MKKKLVLAASAMALALATAGMAVGAADGSTQGTNTFVDGGTELSFWTFQELHVKFWTDIADIWNEKNPDRPINLTVSTGESHSTHSKLLIAC